MKTILVTGGTGLVGLRVSELLMHSFRIVMPSRRAMDLTKPAEVGKYILAISPDVIIHAGACTDATLAEKERGDTRGLCYRTNVLGTRAIAQAARKTGALLCYISTASVFAGTGENPGPFAEYDPPQDLPSLGWYAWTKHLGEREAAEGAIIRISHPVRAWPEGTSAQTDYLRTMLTLFDRGQLYPLFPDQRFAVTLIDDIALGIRRLISERRQGIFHIGSSDLCSPYELGKEVLRNARGFHGELATQKFQDFIRSTPMPKRYAQYHAIDGTATRRMLHLPVRSWKEIVSFCYPDKEGQRIRC